MKKAIASVTKAFDAVNKWICVCFFSLLIVDVTASVLMRYVFVKPMVWGEQLAVYCMMYIGMVGSAIALRKGAHMGMDLLLNKVKGRVRLIMQILVHIAIIAFLGIMIIWGIKHMWAVRDQRSAVLFNISMAWPYMCIPLGGVLMLIQEIGVIVNGIEADFDEETAIENKLTKGEKK